MSKNNKKPVLKFLLSMSIAGVFGGFLGVSMRMGRDVLKELLVNVKHIFIMLSPYVLLIVSSALLLISFIIFRDIKKKILQNGTENEELLETQELRISSCIGFTNIGLIICISLFAVSANGFFNIFPPYFILLFGPVFITVALLTVLFQRRMVEFEKQINPEKQGEVLSPDFQKNWIDSCDEHERQVTYQASYKVYTVNSIIFPIAIGACAMFSIQFPVGVLPSLLLGGMWLIQTVIYQKESRRLFFSGKK